MTDALSHAPATNCPSSTGPSIIDKVRLNRVRQMADRQGLYIVKRGTRCPWGCDYNALLVYPKDGGPPVFGIAPSDQAARAAPLGAYNASLDDVEAWLTERAQPKHRPSKALENRVRRAAHRAGLRLERTKRRDPRAEDFGLYSLIATDGSTAFGPADLTAIERQVRTEVAA